MASVWKCFSVVRLFWCMTRSHAVRVWHRRCNSSSRSAPSTPLYPTREKPMLRWALLFLAVALTAALLGFTTIARPAHPAARSLFFVFLVLFVLSVLLSGRTPRELT